MIFIALLLLAAQDAPVDCAKAMTQRDLSECADLRFQEADREMNAQWRVTLAALRKADKEIAGDGYGPPSAQRLLDAQRAWLTYRDAQCLVEGEYARGGSMRPMLESQCKATLTGERTETLRELLEE
jgi:uncharacterized protein YecT (DUF1311 family)